MPAIDIGDPLPNLAVQVENPPGTLVNVGAMALTVYLPDGTPVAQATPSNPSTGRYAAASPYYATTGGPHRARWVATGANACVKERWYAVGDPVDIDEVRAELKIAQTATDDLLYGWIAAAVDRVQAWTGRRLRQETLTVTRPGGKYAVALPLPVATVVSVTENGTLLAATDYELQPQTGLLYRGSSRALGAVWGAGAGSVVVQLTTSLQMSSKVRQAIVEYVRYLAAGYRGSGQPAAAGSPDDALARAKDLAGARIPVF